MLCRPGLCPRIQRRNSANKPEVMKNASLCLENASHPGLGGGGGGPDDLGEEVF